MRKFNEPFVAGNIYHVFNRTVGNEKLFLYNDNYAFFLSKIQKHILPVADVFCYNLLPNHFHLMVRIKPFETIKKLFNEMKPLILQKKYDENLSLFISEQFGNCCNSYTKSFNKVYNRKGKLFMDNLNRRLIDSETYYSKTVHYIHANAVKHGMCKKIEDWQWSSYFDIFKNNSGWLLTGEVLDWFCGKNGFIKFHQQEIIKR